MHPKYSNPIIIMIGNNPKTTSDILERFPDLDYEVWSNEQRVSKADKTPFKATEKAEVLELINQGQVFFLASAEDWEDQNPLTTKFPTSDGLITLQVLDIIFCEKEIKGTKIKLRGGSIHTNQNLSQTQAQLSLLPLQQINPNCLLNLHFVTHYTNKNEVELINKQKLKVSKPYQKILADRLLIKP